MNTCRTRKHWVDMRLVSPAETAKRCDVIDLDESSRPGNDRIVAYAYIEGNDALTGPDFGCVHHEASICARPQNDPYCQRRQNGLLARIPAACGLPDPAEACRLILGLIDEAEGRLVSPEEGEKQCQK